MPSSSSSGPSGSNPRWRRMSTASMSGLPPRMMSVPRPAMLVAMVTAPTRPACATMTASRSWCLAFSVSCFMPRLSKSRDSFSEFSMDTVPMRQGCPASWRAWMSSATALNFASTVR